MSTSGDCILESGGDIGSSGRSSRNLDIVRLGRLDGILTGVYPVCGAAWLVCIESREVLEKDGAGMGSGAGLGFGLLLKNDVQDCGGRVLVSEIRLLD